MLWEELSSKEIEAAVVSSGGVCVIPIGAIEKHGDHLPVGTDMYIVNAVAKAAVDIEPAVVFPYYFMGQISEARHYKGTLAASHKLLMEALLEMCDEVYRNGFNKIMLLSGHGGNDHFLQFFAQMFPGINRPYAFYCCFAHNASKEQYEAIVSLSGVEDMGGHAGFSETSLMMHVRPDLVHMDRVKVEQSATLGRLAETQKHNIMTGFDWYADHPYHFAGDPSCATPEYGEFIFNILRENTANAIRAIKNDKVSEELITEFNKLAN